MTLNDGILSKQSTIVLSTIGHRLSRLSLIDSFAKDSISIEDLKYCVLLEELEIRGFKPNDRDQSVLMEIDTATFLPS